VRRLLVAAAVVVVSASGLTAPAHAEGLGFSDELVFTGCVDLRPPEQAVGGSGTADGLRRCQPPFTNVPVTCTIVSDAEMGSTGNEVENCNLTLAVTYVNIVCGFGTWAGTMTVTSPSESYVIVFTVTYAGGQGSVSGISSSEETGFVDQWTGTITRLASGPCPVSEYAVVGSLTANDIPG
jgi:hypothetical protein